MKKLLSAIRVLGSAASLSAFSLWTSSLSAQTVSQVYGTTLDKQTMTAYVEADTSMMTYESETAASKETQQANSFAVGGYAGEARRLGIQMRSSDNVVPFDLNQSTLRNSWQDVRMQARFGWVYPSVSASLTQFKVDQADTSVVDLYGSGVGAGVGVYVPLTEEIVVFTDTHITSTPNAYDKTGKEVTLGNRKDADLGASIDITPRTVDLLVGYRYRAFDVKIDESKREEVRQGAYAGLRMGLYF